MTYFESRSWNADCDVCGKTYKSADMHQRWDGRMVCRRCHDFRHILDFLRPKRDIQNVPWVRLEPADIFIGGAPITTPYVLCEDTSNLTAENGDRLIYE